MWARLSAQHLQNAAENQHVLQQRFCTNTNLVTTAHITEIETMTIQLQDIGAPVNPLQVITQLYALYPLVSAVFSLPGTALRSRKRRLPRSPLVFSKKKPCREDRVTEQKITVKLHSSSETHRNRNDSAGPIRECPFRDWRGRFNPNYIYALCKITQKETVEINPGRSV